MKKLLLGLATLSLAALPVLAVASCSAKTPTIIMKGSLNTGEVTAADQKTTIAAIITYEKSPKNNIDKNNLIIALNLKSFSNLVAIDLPNYIITFDPTPEAETITLTAKDGYEFAGEALTLVSKIKPEDSLLLGSLNAGEVTTDDMETTIAAIKAYERSSKNDEDKTTLINALNLKSFSDLVAIDLPNLVITYTEIPGSETITLTAKPGFKFSTNTPLLSIINIVVIPGSLNTGEVTTDDQNTTIRAIEAYKRSSKNDEDKDTLIAALNLKSFSYLVKADLHNLVITYNNNTFGRETITLTPNKGFKFSTNTPLLSTIVAVIPGAINSGTVTTDDQKTTIAAIKAYERSSKNDEDKTTLINALNLKSFAYLVKADLLNLVITYTEIPGSETITLTAKPGFKFSTNTPLLSTINIVTMPGAIKSGIVTTAEIKTTIAAIKTYKAITDPNNEDKDTLIAALNLKSFEGLVKGDLTNFVITYDETVGINISETITLTAKDRFKFGTGTSLVSRINAVTIPGAINSGTISKVNIRNLIGSIKTYETSPKTDADKNNLIRDLNYKVFTGLVKGDLPNYAITYNETEGSESITLIAKDGFEFRAGKELTPIVNGLENIPGAINSGTITIINIQNLIGSVKAYQKITDPTDAQKISITNDLNYKVFTGLVKGDLTNFVITCDETVGSESITLTAKDGFEFGTGKVLVIGIIPGSLNTGAVTTDDMKTTIAAIEVYKAITTPDDRNKDTLIAALNLKSFEGLLLEDVDNFVISYTETVGSETITLTPKTGFKFGTGTPLISNISS